MALKLADVGAVKMLDAYFTNTYPTGGSYLTIKLYTNNYDPSADSVAADFAEANGGSYAAKSIAATDWTVSTVSSIAQAQANQQTWEFTTTLTADALATPPKTDTIYGYYVIDADGTLIYAEKSTVSFKPINPGDILMITPKFQLSYGTPA